MKQRHLCIRLPDIRNPALVDVMAAAQSEPTALRPQLVPHRGDMRKFVPMSLGHIVAAAIPTSQQAPQALEACMAKCAHAPEWD